MKGQETVLLFVTTEAALRAEDVLLGLGFEVDVIPKPPGLSGLCGLALTVEETVLAQAEGVLRLEDVQFSVYRPDVIEGAVALDAERVYTADSASSGGGSRVGPPDNRILTPAPAVRPGPHESEGGEPN
jgi:Protein of unknown function (DUF3343).